MRFAPLLGLSLLLAATSAQATGGFICRATDGSGIALGGTVGHVIGSPLVGARLQLEERALATTDAEPQVAIGRSWIDTSEIRVDLVDANFERFEAQLRVRVDAHRGARGTLLREGVTHPVRCETE